MNQQEFFNRYRYDLRKDKLGGGSFGTVYKAYDHVLDRHVAIKVSEVKQIGDKEFSLNDEYKAVSKVRQHPNIAFYENVYTFESPQGVFDYAIMQFYKDGNLSEYLQNNLDIDHPLRVEIATQIMEGIEHLHQNGLVHRDLKPGNIMVVKRENGLVVPKITDFGLSKYIDNNASRFQSSFAGGTIQYSSPEQIKGEEYKRNTDWWSFGVIAYEVFTGERLFEVSGVSSASIEWQNKVSEQILKADFREKLNKITDEKWQSVLSACLEKDKAKRVQSATEIKLLLSQNHQHEPHTRVDEAPTTIPKTEVIHPHQENTPKVEPTRVMPSQPRPNNNYKKSNNNIYLMAGLGALLFFIASGFGFYYFFIKKETPIETISLFQENNLYGYKKGSEIIIEPKFENAEEFVKGEAKVTKGDSIFFIDEKGKWIRTLNPDPDPIPDPEPDPNPDPNPAPDPKPNIAEIKKKGLELYYSQKNYSEAYPLVLECAQAGDPECQHATAYILENGAKVVPKNLKASFDWYLKAANGDLPKSMHAVGIKYRDGDDAFNRNIDLAESWLLKAAKAGYVFSMDSYASLRYYSNYNMQDFSQAKFWYEEAYRKGYLSGEVLFNLGNIYYFGYGTDIDYAKAFDFYTQAVGKHYKANGALGDMYYEGDYVQKDYQKASSYFQKGCADKDEFSCHKLGNMHYYGRGVPQSYTEAAIYWEKAAEMGYSEAYYNLGSVIYLDGKSGTPDREKAVYWLKKAAEAGNTMAKSKLNSIGESW